MASSGWMPPEVFARRGAEESCPLGKIPFPRSPATCIFPLPLASSQIAWASDQIPNDRHSRQNNKGEKKKKKSRLFFIERSC